LQFRFNPQERPENAIGLERSGDCPGRFGKISFKMNIASHDPKSSIGSFGKSALKVYDSISFNLQSLRSARLQTAESQVLLV
jgi:hypothetical protein